MTIIAIRVALTIINFAGRYQTVSIHLILPKNLGTRHTLTILSFGFLSCFDVTKKKKTLDANAHVKVPKKQTKM